MILAIIDLQTLVLFAGSLVFKAQAVLFLRYRVEEKILDTRHKLVKRQF